MRSGKYIRLINATALPGKFLKFAGMQQSKQHHLKLLGLLKHSNFTCLHVLLFFEVTADNMKEIYDIFSAMKI